MPQPPSFSAATMFLRASTLAIGATESSRSRNTWSASSPFALARNRGFDPGVARQDRLLRKTCSVIPADLPGSVTHRSLAAYGEIRRAAPGDIAHCDTLSGEHRGGCDRDRGGDEEGRTGLAVLERRTARSRPGSRRSTDSTSYSRMQPIVPSSHCPAWPRPAPRRSSYRPSPPPTAWRAGQRQYGGWSPGSEEWTAAAQVLRTERLNAAGLDTQLERWKTEADLLVLEPTGEITEAPAGTTTVRAPRHRSGPPPPPAARHRSPCTARSAAVRASPETQCLRVSLRHMDERSEFIIKRSALIRSSAPAAKRGRG